MDKLALDSDGLKRCLESPASKLLPIMIIPGFMDSGLKVHQSKIRPEWEGERIWMGFPLPKVSPSYCGAPHEEKDRQSDQEQQEQCKAVWLDHVELDPNMRDEKEGVKLAPTVELGALEGLTEESSTDEQKSSFDPLIRALEKAGYNDSTINLEAAPYDWRMSPLHLELNHQYFSKTIQMIEDMYQRNKYAPVILLGYSLGAKVAHYLLNFAMLKKGKAWVSSRIYSFVPVAAPLLGAPMILRSIIGGDMMGLSNCLNDEELLGLQRSFGSLPWLLPSMLPPGVPSSAYVMSSGTLFVEFPFGMDPSILIQDRQDKCKPNQLRLVMSCGQKGDPISTAPQKTMFSEISPEGICVFEEFMTFSAGPRARKRGNFFQIALHEPSLAESTSQETKNGSISLWILKFVTLYFIYEAIAKILQWVIHDPEPPVMASDEHGSPLALSEPIALPVSVFKGKAMRFKVALYHKTDYESKTATNPRTSVVHVHIRWKRFRSKLPPRAQSRPISEVAAQTPTLKVRNGRHQFKGMNGDEMLQRVGLNDFVESATSLYEEDKQLGPLSFSSSFDAPPVDRVHAIYGTNVPTEIGGVYELKDATLKPGGAKNVYCLSNAATLSHSQYSLKKGLIRETPRTKQVAADNRRACGDGVVPYWSLFHVNTWKGSDREVTVTELEDVGHEDILSNSRFHEELQTYSRREAQKIAKSRKVMKVPSRASVMRSNSGTALPGTSGTLEPPDLTLSSDSSSTDSVEAGSSITHASKLELNQTTVRDEAPMPHSNDKEDSNSSTSDSSKRDLENGPTIVQSTPFPVESQQMAPQDATIAGTCTLVASVDEDFPMDEQD
eukprot:scaffold1784_cov116-Cylindrotheca_fusiformis.AAC.19